MLSNPAKRRIYGVLIKSAPNFFGSYSLSFEYAVIYKRGSCFA
jgi:hypothetical protein